MSKKKNKSVVRAEIPSDLKDEAVAYLQSIGVSQSEVIYLLFRYIAENKEIPFEQVLSIKND